MDDRTDWLNRMREDADLKGAFGRFLRAERENHDCWSAEALRNRIGAVVGRTVAIDPRTIRRIERATWKTGITGETLKQLALGLGYKDLPALFEAFRTWHRTDDHEPGIIPGHLDASIKLPPRGALLSTSTAKCAASSWASGLQTREQAYSAIADLVAKLSKTRTGEKRLKLASVFGLVEPRIVEKGALSPQTTRFVREIRKCIQSCGANRWDVQILYNITDTERLEQVLERLEMAKDAEGYEVRAFSVQGALPLLTPLIVDTEDLFIGVDDQHYHRVRCVVHIHDPAAVAVANEYWASLWDDRRLFQLRTGAGTAYAEINRLRTAITRNNTR